MSDMILFDLDGTLTDSGPGITRCVQYALASFGIEEPDLEKLNCYVGPPLPCYETERATVTAALSSSFYEKC